MLPSGPAGVRPYFVDRASAVRHDSRPSTNTRQPPGPEADLVARFLEIWPLRPRFGFRIKLFEQPKLQSGRPDMVAVVWDENASIHWSRSDGGLNRAELRLLHLLVTAGPSDVVDLGARLPDLRSDSIDRLESTGLVALKRHRIAPRRLTEILAVRAVVAIEAKIDNWRSVLTQARLNQWFASESYVLAPGVNDRSKLLGLASAFGIGVWTISANGFAQRLAAQLPLRFPVSYGTWLFNEWLRSDFDVRDEPFSTRSSMVSRDIS